MRIFKKSFVAPQFSTSCEAALYRANCRPAKGLRRRFKTPEKYFSGELSNGSYPALFETAASAKTPLVQGASHGDCRGVAFPLSEQGRHTESLISGLNGWPACAVSQRITRHVTMTGA